MLELKQSATDKATRGVHESEHSNTGVVYA